MRKFVGKRQFWSYKVWKLEEDSHETLVLRPQHVSSRFSGLLVPSPCLWEKLKNLSFSKLSKHVVMSFCVAGMALPDISTCLQKCRKSFCVAVAILLKSFRRRVACFVAVVAVWRSPGGRYFRLVLFCVFYLNFNARAAPSGVNVHIVWQAWDIERVSFCVAGAGFGEDPSCVECHFAWRPQYLAHSTLHTPHYTLHFTLHTLHFTLPTLQFTVNTPTLYTLHSALYTLQWTLRTLDFTLHTLHFTLRTLHFTLRSPHYTRHFTLYTPHSLRSTLQTPHSTLYTLHSALCTPHSAHYTLHSTLCTLHFTLHTLHFTLCYTLLPSTTPYDMLLHPTLPLHTFNALRSTIYTPHSTFYTLHSALYTPHFTLHTLYFSLCTLHLTLRAPHSTLYALHSALCTLYTLHFTLRTLHFTLRTSLDTVHSTLYTPHFSL